MDYEESQPYKLGLIYRRIADVLMNPNTTVEDLMMIAKELGFEWKMEIVPNSDSPVNGCAE